MTDTRNMWALFALIGIALLSGCQSTGGVKGEKNAAATATSGDKALEKRAEQRWGLLIEKKAEKAYDFLTPGYRKTMTREHYAMLKNNVAMTWQGVKVTSMKCEPETCEVLLTIDYEIMMPAGGGRMTTFAPLREKWVKLSGQWYFLPEK